MVSVSVPSRSQNLGNHHFCGQDWFSTPQESFSGQDPSTQPGSDTFISQFPGAHGASWDPVPILCPLCSLWEWQPPPALIHGVLGALKDPSLSEREAAFWLFL